MPGNLHPPDDRIFMDLAPTVVFSPSHAPHRAADILSSDRNASPVITRVENIDDSGGSRGKRNDQVETRRRLMERHGSPVSAGVNLTLGFDKDAPASFEEAMGDERDDRDTVSIITAATDFSTETAIVGRAEWKMSTIAEESNPLNLVASGNDHSISGRITTAFGPDSSRPSGIDSMEVTDSKDENGRAENFYSSGGGSLKMGDVDVDMDMRSALDRLMDDVAGTKGDTSILPDEDDLYNDRGRSSWIDGMTDREPTGSNLLGQGFASRDSRASSTSSIPPPLPPKDNIRSRERIIIEKKRAARRATEDEFDMFVPTPKVRKEKRSQELLGVGRPSRRRSMSTGDVDRLDRHETPPCGTLLETGVKDVDRLDEHFGDSIEKELQKKLEGGPQKQPKTVSSFQPS